MIQHKVVTMTLDELKVAPYNPRRISKEALKGLTASVKRFGLVQPIVMNQRTGLVVGGHQRIEALRALGQKETPVVMVDLSPIEEKALNVALNSPSISGSFTDELQPILSEVREQLAHEFIDMRFDELLKSLTPDAATEDDIPEPPKDPVTKTGDTWILGDHVLLCGDTTDAKATGARIQAVGFPHLLFTSPPYWVGKSYEYQKTEDEVVKFIWDSVGTMASVMQKDHTRILINTGTGNGMQFTKKVETLLLVDQYTNALRRHGWLLRHLRFWVKDGKLPAHVATRNDFICQSCEFVATFYHRDGKNRGMNRLPDKWTQQGYLDDLPVPSQKGEHQAVFPVELPHRFIRLYTKPGELVLDPFGGAGTTMIACQQTGRKAILVERDRRYCDVIVERWQRFTGGTATRKP